MVLSIDKILIQKALEALIELGKTGKQNVAFGVVSTLVNLTNSFDKQVKFHLYSNNKI